MDTLVTKRSGTEGQWHVVRINAKVGAANADVAVLYLYKPLFAFETAVAALTNIESALAWRVAPGEPPPPPTMSAPVDDPALIPLPTNQ